MVRQLLLGGVLGGIVLFMWLGLSWAVLPFHRAALKELPLSQPADADSSGVAAGIEMLSQAGLWHGVYYSGMPHAGSQAPEIPFMIYLPQGYPAQAGVMLRGVLLSILAALLVTFIVLSARQPRFKSRVALCTCTGAVVALAGPMTFGNFFFFPLDFMVPEVLDQLIGWTLAGLVIAAFTGPQSAATAAQEL